jgi:hypothetical protein
MKVKQMQLSQDDAQYRLMPVADAGDSRPRRNWFYQIAMQYAQSAGCRRPDWGRDSDPLRLCRHTPTSDRTNG